MAYVIWERYPGPPSDPVSIHPIPTTLQAKGSSCRSPLKILHVLSGVSRSTVSQVINADVNVNDETRRKVLEVINYYNFQPNLACQGAGNRAHQCDWRGHPGKAFLSSLYRSLLPPTAPGNFLRL